MSLILASIPVNGDAGIGDSAPRNRPPGCACVRWITVRGAV